MKPKPFCELKNLTVPCAMLASFENADRRQWAARYAQPCPNSTLSWDKPRRANNKDRQNLERRIYRTAKAQNQPAVLRGSSLWHSSRITEETVLNDSGRRGHAARRSKERRRRRLRCARSN